MSLLFLFACSHLEPWPVADTAGLPEERIAVSPGSLAFGAVSVNGQGSVALPLTIFNLGADAVTVTGQDEPIGDEAEFRVDALPVLTLDVDESRTVEVIFVPGTEGEFLARLRFDPGSEVVELTGSGRAPVLAVTINDIPATVLGCTGAGHVTVENRGSEPLTLDVSATGADFVVTGWPPEIGVGEAGVVDVAFTPDGGGARGGVLTLTTNDPLQPQAAVELEGLGYEGEHVKERFVYAPALPTDVIFAVQGDQFASDSRLGPALTAYAERVHDAELDLHLTSVGSGSPCPAEAPAWSASIDSVLGVENLLGHGFDSPAGSWDTDLLGLVERALFEAEPGGCLDGLRRESAALDIVLVAADPPEADAVAEFAALAAELPDGTSVRVSALVPRTSECGDPNTSYAALAAANNGAVGDLCAESWTAAFAAFAALPVVAVDARYPLAEAPVPSSIAVTADGANFAGWTYDSVENSVVVSAEAAPTVGAELTVNYVSAVSCGE